MKNDKMEKAIIGVAGDSNILNALIPHLPENVKKQIANRRTLKRSGKMLDIWTQIDFQIRQQKFPILFLCKPAPAVIISQEEYKELKKLKELLTQNFDVSTQANEIIAKGGIITGYSLTPRGIEVEGKIPYEKRPKE